MRHRRSIVVVLLAGIAAVIWPTASRACPFCSAVTQTLGEELRGSDVGVIAVLVATPDPVAAAGDGSPALLDAKPSRFKIRTVLKGADLLAGKQEIEVVYFGQAAFESTFLIMGTDPAQIAWATPIGLTADAVAYVGQLPAQPESGADRLVFFQRYLEHPEPMLAQDAYDEFAKAPYADVRAFKPHMDRPTLLARIQDQSLAASRRRLYLTMLGVCGQPEDLPLLEQLIGTKKPELRTTLDAMVAAYLTLKGPDGLKLIEDLFFRDPAADFTDTYSALVALRFHGQEEQVVPKARLVEAFRLMLDRPQYADLVIPDLARWEDWESIDRLVDLFKTATEESSWVRTPVVQYLRVCPLPRAQELIKELEQIDPEAVKRANSFLPFATAAAAVPAPAVPAPAVPAGAPVPGPEVSAATDTPVAPPPDLPGTSAQAADAAEPDDGQPLPADPATTDLTASGPSLPSALPGANVEPDLPPPPVPTEDSEPSGADPNAPADAAVDVTAATAADPTSATTTGPAIAGAPAESAATLASATPASASEDRDATEVPGVTRGGVLTWAAVIGVGLFLLVSLIVFVGNRPAKPSA